MPEPFPKVQGGGSLLLAWQVRNKNVVVIGGGEVAAGRILNLLNADARIILIAPRTNLHPEIAHRLSLGEIASYRPRPFIPLDLDPSYNIALVLVAIDDPDASSRIWKYCKTLSLPVNVADVPPECDFYFGSVHRDGPLQVMVSTNGNGPKLASMVRKIIAGRLPEGIGGAVERVGLLRRKLRKVAPGQAVGPQRMRWMSRVCETWSLEELGGMSEEDMRVLLGGFGEEEVPSLEEVRLGRRDGVVWEFDGSFGWAV